MTPQEERNKRFDEKFDKPISDEAHRYLNLPNKVGVYYDNTDIKDFLTSEVNLAIEQVEKWAESRRMPVDKPDEDVSANALAEIFETKLEAFDYSTNSFIDDLLAFLKELKK